MVILDVPIEFLIVGIFASGVYLTRTEIFMHQLKKNVDKVCTWIDNHEPHQEK